MDGFGLAAAGRSLLRNYDDVDRMLPDRDRLAAVQDRACRSNALRLIRCIGVPNGIAVKLQLFHSLSGKPRNVQGEQAVFGEGLVHNGEINRAVSGRGHRVYGGDVLIDELIGQAADGFGEGLEQREIKTDDGDIYVSFWHSGNDYFMENEMDFQQRMSDNLGFEEQQIGGL